MSKYTVAIVQDEAQAQHVEKMNIGIANWGGDYRPNTWAQLAYIKGQGFWLRLHCDEQNPRRTFTQPDQPVFQDSCLEGFINFNPDDPKIGYINFEINANGAMWCAVGRQRHGRIFLRRLGIQVPQPEVQMDAQGWTATVLIPLELIYSVYGEIPFEQGSRLAGNFYKCGDATEQPHYLSWAPIPLPNPDYHTPEHFGVLTLGE